MICASSGCVDVQDPIRIRKLKEWAESDALFLQKLSMAKEEEDKRDKFPPSLGFTAGSVSDSSRQSLDERFACRQRYLRSYRFGRDPEENPEEKVNFIGKTKRQWIKLKKLNEKNKGKVECSCNFLLKGGLKLLFLNPVYCLGGLA